MAGTVPMATRSSRSRPCMVNTMPITATASGWSARTAYVDGRAVDLRDLLTDDRYASFLNSDGTLTGATIRLASR